MADGVMAAGDADDPQPRPADAEERSTADDGETAGETGGETAAPAPPPGRWRLDPAAVPPGPGHPAAGPAADFVTGAARPQPRGAWVAPAPGSRLFPPATAARPVLPWERPAADPGGVANGRGPDAPLASDVGTAVALAVDAGVVLVMLGAIVTGLAGRSFIGSALVTQVDRSYRFRLLAVFRDAGFGPAVALGLATVAVVAVPAAARSRWRRWALAVTAGLGVFVAAAALLRAVVFLTFAGTSAGLAIGSLLDALAAVPVASAVSAWAWVLFNQDER